MSWPDLLDEHVEALNATRAELADVAEALHRSQDDVCFCAFCGEFLEWFDTCGHCPHSRICYAGDMACPTCLGCKEEPCPE